MFSYLVQVAILLKTESKPNSDQENCSLQKEGLKMGKNGLQKKAATVGSRTFLLWC